MKYYGGAMAWTVTIYRDLLTYCETAVLLGLPSEAAVKRLVKAGKLPRYRVGHRTVRIRRVDAEAYAQNNGGIQDTLV